MAIINVNPTAMELGNLKKRYAVATKGHKLLKDKLDELMRRFLLLVKEAKELRKKTEADAVKISDAVKKAKNDTKPQIFEDALISSFSPLLITEEKQYIVNVKLPRFSYKKPENVCSYGYAFTGISLDRAVSSLSEFTDSLIRLAEKEKAIDILSGEIGATRRRVNSLEHILIPDLTDTIRYITSKLDEADRSNRIRLIKVKDLVIKNKSNN